MTLSLFWFHVMLPYVFLMNTSHNKNLVIDDGWLNTIQNTLGLSEQAILLPCQCWPFLLRLTTWKGRDQIEKNQKNANTNQRSKAEDKVSNIPSGFSSDPVSKVNGDIYVISKPFTSTSQSEKESIHSVNVLSEMPSNGSGIIKIKHRKNKTGVIKKTPSESDEDRSTPQISHRLCVGEKLLSYMLMHINSEEEYLHYLKQLSRFEETVSKGFRLHEEFSLGHIVEFAVPKRTRVKNFTFQILKEPTNTKPSQSRKPKKKSKNESPIDKNRPYRLIGNVLDRIERRKKLFGSFQGYHEDEECYIKFVGALFDVEENFTYG